MIDLTDEEAIGLTDEEAEALGRYLIGEYHPSREFFSWEDLPHLSREAFAKVDGVISRTLRHLTMMHPDSIDPAALLAKARGIDTEAAEQYRAAYQAFLRTCREARTAATEQHRLIDEDLARTEERALQKLKTSMPASYELPIGMGDLPRQKEWNDTFLPSD
ncbi:MAG: hypothetical protein WC977_07900 [Anaerovoracaceae bacterium]|jgi:hypothetical protein